MAKLTVSDLTTPVSREEVQSSIYRVLSTLGVNTSAWKPGSVMRTMIVAVSAVFAAYSQLMAQSASAGFLATSSGDWLTLVAWYVYGIARREATYASGTLTLVNAGGGLYIIDTGDLIVRNAATGASYRNTEAFTSTPGSTIHIGIMATEPGSSSNADPHAIGLMVTTLLKVTCDNATGLYGQDEEPDPTVRERCSEVLGQLSPLGPWDAYFAALRNATRADNGTNLGITRVRVEADGYGHVDCYAATDAGGVPGDMNDPDTDLGAAQVAVLRNAAPLAVTARVHTAIETPVNVSYSVWIYSSTGKSPAQIEAAIHDQLEYFILHQPVGGNVIDDAATGYIYLDAIQRAIADTFPAAIFRTELTIPADDIPFTPAQVATVGDIIPVLIKQVAPPEAFHP